MSSHPHEVPKGWTKGEKLKHWQAGGWWLAGQALTYASMKLVHPDDIAVIRFENKADLLAFLDWWSGERKAFEAWVGNKHMLFRKDEPGYEHEYEHPWTCGAWAAWQQLHGIEVKNDH